MNFRFLLSLLVVVAICQPAVAQDEELSPVGPNLVKNASLEDTRNGMPIGWVQRTWSGEPVFEIEEDFAHSGKRCVKISSIKGADSSWSYELKVKRNTDYRVSVWVKTRDLAAGGFGAQVNLHELQLEGKTDPIRGTKDWTQLSSEFNTGNRDTLLLNLLFGGWGRATGTAWFDDVEVRELKGETPEPPQMTPDEAKEFFAAKVLPVLEKNCFKCHGGGEKLKAELVMTNREDLLKGGESGEAIDLESPLDSLLLSAINYEDYEMPPIGKLPQSDIDNITKWVQLGVPWKGEGFKPKTEHAEMSPKVTAETKKFWSYQKPARPDVPRSGNKWVSNDIDEFILAKLKEKDLSPNDRASKRTLVRRAYYDLIGLPPTTAEVEAFVDDASPDAYEQLIDRLLESKHYGEKWGRHWLDLVRYAESNSYERDGTKPFVWRYRDYVIRSLNDDKPYDQFVIEQLAGDELEEETPDKLIATGYYRLGKWDDEPVDHKQAWYDDMDDVLAVTSQAFLGMTINCARCHDHKIDPVPQSDYYSMLAFFRNVQRYGVRGHDTVLRQSTQFIASQKEQTKYDQEVQAHREAVNKNRNNLKKIEELVRKDFIPVEHEEFKHEMNRVPLVEKRIGKSIDGTEFTEAMAKRYKRLFTQMRELRRSPPKQLERALCVTEKDANRPKNTFVLIRGNAHAESKPVEPAFPSVLSPPEPVIQKPGDGKTTGRRLALAKWIASPDNPLTSRVIVNRIWQHHFGRGIVKSSNDFGFQGTPPTHPQLLDWLADEFVAGGWKMKRLHKLIMMSSAYQMSSKAQKGALAIDPVNDLFWRFNMRRLTAEEVRDSILAVNGTLNKDKMFGPSIYPVIEKEVLHGQSRPGENWGNSSPEDITRRSIYIHIKRSLPVPLMASFDAADPDSTCPVRFNTVQPTQALGMINSQFVNEQAKKFAELVRKNVPDDVVGQIQFALQQVFQREPTDEEVEFGVSLLKDLQTKGIAADRTLELYCVVALNLNEFLFLD